MTLEVGEIFEGKISGVTKFGAFVTFGENKTGMVHISEISHTFVKEIKDHVTEGQEVKVMIISISPEGKIALSMKKTEEKPKVNFGERNNNHNKSTFQPREQRSSRPPKKPYEPPVQSAGRPGDFEWQSKGTSVGGGNFEDMLSKFKQSSDEKISDLKRNTESRRGGGSRRDGQK